MLNTTENTTALEELQKEENWRWGIISEYLHYVDEHWKECKGNANIYPASDDVAYNHERDFLIVEGWEFVNEFNEWLEKNYGKELEEKSLHSLPESNGIEGYGNPRHDWTWWLDYLTNDQWGFYDEYSVCDCCYEVIRTEPTSYSWTPDYNIFNYGEFICGDCIRENKSYQEDYLTELINEPTKANTILDESTFEDLGFQRIDGTYENGWYDRVDDPKEILKKLLNKFPDAEVVFSITSNQQFCIRFVTWIRFNDEEEEE